MLVPDLLYKYTVVGFDKGVRKNQGVRERGEGRKEKTCTV